MFGLHFQTPTKTGVCRESLSEFQYAICCNTFSGHFIALIVFLALVTTTTTRNLFNIVYSRPLFCVPQSCFVVRFCWSIGRWHHSSWTFSIWWRWSRIQYARWTSSRNHCECNTSMNYLPRWLSWLRHSVHWPGRSVGGARVQFPGSAGRFRVWISGAHALRLISRAGKEGSTVSSIICDCWLILS